MKGGAAVADGDRPIVLVPLATARRAARRAGVTLNLSVEDIQLAGKWKHGWIPLDAVAAAVKAKRYHGGGEGRTVKGKGRAGSAVEARREPSRGRTKAALPTRTRTFSDAGDTTVSRREHGLPTGGRKAARANPVGSKLEHSEPRYVTPGAAKAEGGPPASLADHARAHSDASLRDLTSRFSKGTAEGRAVRAEIARRAKRDGATGRAQQVAQDRTRRLEAARGEPKLADLSEADLQGLISRYGEKSVQADAARAEMLRRGLVTASAAKSDDLIQRASAGTDWPARRRAVAEAASQGRATMVPAGARNNPTAEIHIDGTKVGQASNLHHLVEEDPVQDSRGTFKERRLRPRGGRQ